MFKRIGALAMLLAGSMAVFTPAVAQARDRDDFRRNDRCERREFREHERWERRHDRPVYYYYDRFGRRICR